MPLFAVIDTNVLVSALLKRDSTPGKIIQSVANGIIVPVIHQDIIAEYKRVLAYKKFHFPADKIDALMAMFEERGIAVKPVAAGELMPDLSDVIFYEVMLGIKAHTDGYLVTGNSKHFPVKPFVVTPREMLEIIEKNC